MTVLEKIRDKESGSWSRVYANAITTTTIIIIILIMMIIIIMRIEESIEGEFNVWFQV